MLEILIRQLLCDWLNWIRLELNVEKTVSVVFNNNAYRLAIPDSCLHIAKGNAWTHQHANIHTALSQTSCQNEGPKNYHLISIAHIKTKAEWTKKQWVFSLSMLELEIYFRLRSSLNKLVGLCRIARRLHQSSIVR